MICAGPLQAEEIEQFAVLSVKKDVDIIFF